MARMAAEDFPSPAAREAAMTSAMFFAPILPSATSTLVNHSYSLSLSFLSRTISRDSVSSSGGLWAIEVVTM